MESIGSFYCFADHPAFADQDNHLDDLGAITVFECADACFQNAECEAIQMGCGTDCLLLPGCSQPKQSGCGSHSYFIREISNFILWVSKQAKNWNETSSKLILDTLSYICFCKTDVVFH